MEPKANHFPHPTQPEMRHSASLCQSMYNVTYKQASETSETSPHHNDKQFYHTIWNSKPDLSKFQEILVLYRKFLKTLSITLDIWNVSRDFAPSSYFVSINELFLSSSILKLNPQLNIPGQNWKGTVVFREKKMAFLSKRTTKSHLCQKSRSL